MLFFIADGKMDNSLNQITYDKFKKDILTFALKPGDTVSAAKIADRYVVSRTPAREALVKLEAEGLVDIIPQSKSVISKIDLNKARQEWFIRSSLELGMVDSFFEKVTDADVEKMRFYNNTMHELAKLPRNNENSYKYLLADNAFHAVTYEVSGEKLAANVIGNTMAHYLRLRFLTDLDEYYQGRTSTGHTEMLGLVEKRDIEGYRSALKVHLSHILNDMADLEKLYPDYFV